MGCVRDFLLYAGEVRPSADQPVRPAAVAGAFYPGDAASLRAEVDALLANAAPRKLTPKLLIAPHAGYVYSGPIAASAYRLLENLAPKPSRVANTPRPSAARSPQSSPLSSNSIRRRPSPGFRMEARPPALPYRRNCSERNYWNNA